MVVTAGETEAATAVLALDDMVGDRAPRRLALIRPLAFDGLAAIAALPPDISRVFIGLGLPVLQGYGLTETSPMSCANCLARPN